MIEWSFQFDADVCPLPSLRFTGPWRAASAGGAGAAGAVLQPGAVVQRVSLVWRPGRRQTLHARVIVLSGLCLVLLHHTGEAASIGGGAGEVVTLGDGLGPATEKRTVLGAGERLGGALIGRVVRFGILRDVTTVRGLLGIEGDLSLLMDLLNVFDTNGTTSPGAEGAGLFPGWAFPRYYQRLFYCSYPYGTASTSIFTGTFAWDKQ